MILPDVNLLVHAHATDADFLRFRGLRRVNPCR